MANKQTSMSKVRQILKLYSQGIGKKKIGNRLCMSKNTVKQYLDRSNQLKTTIEELLKLNDYELDKLFHPPHETLVNERVQMLYDYFPEMERQLRKRNYCSLSIQKIQNSTSRNLWRVGVLLLLPSLEKESKSKYAY